jgi:hypothetical protein
MLAKGRQGDLRNFGARNGRAKVTADDVRAIRASNETIRALAQRYALGETTVGHILNRRSWRHVP